MLNYITAFIRLLLLLLLTFFSALLCWLIMPFLPHRGNGRIIRVWSGIMLFLTGGQLQIKGQTNNNYFPANTLVAANHLSWLDILILYRIYFINFIGKVEMSNWPILSKMIKAGGTIFIDRSRKRDLLKVNHLVSQYLIEGRCIGFFPEGAVGEGDELLPFKAPILESALIAKSKLIPIVILYYRRDGSIATETNFGKQFNLMQSVINTLKLNGFVAKAVVLETIDTAAFESREQLTQYLFKQIDGEFHNR